MSDDSDVRLDKWLWAARLFKTRGLAAEAVTGGKVHLNGARARPAKSVRIGDALTVRRGVDEIEIVVRGCNDRRRPASEAVELYDETAESIDRRARLRAQHAAVDARISSLGRPSKKDRRDARRFTRADRG